MEGILVSLMSILILALIVCLGYAVSRVTKAETKNEGLDAKIIGLEKSLDYLNDRTKHQDELLNIEKENYKKLLGQKKSSEVRLGQICENMAPFFDQWPYDPKQFRFLGNPVDGIQFTDDGVIFIEIKSGKSQLSHPQKVAKKLITEGKVYFATFRVNENGALLKVEENNLKGV